MARFYTAAFSYEYTPAIFRNKLPTLLVYEQSSLARNGQLEELFFYILLSAGVHIYSVYKTSRSGDVVCLN